MTTFHDVASACEELARKHNLACEEFTQKQLADVLRQVLLSGDIQKLVSISNGGQTIIYIPFNKVESLKSKIERLNELLSENGIETKETPEM